MHKAAFLSLLIPAVLARLHPANPLLKRDDSGQCMDTQQKCGDGCIGFIMTCCPVAPNGQQGSCGVGENCWFAEDGSPACCPLFHDCTGTRASNLPGPSTISVAGPTTATDVGTTAPTMTPPKTQSQVSSPPVIFSTSVASVPLVSKPSLVPSSSPAHVWSASSSAIKSKCTVTSASVISVPWTPSSSVALSQSTKTSVPSTTEAIPPALFTGAATANRWPLVSLVGGLLVAGQFLA